MKVSCNDRSAGIGRGLNPVRGANERRGVGSAAERLSLGTASRLVSASGVLLLFFYCKDKHGMLKEKIFSTNRPN